MNGYKDIARPVIAGLLILGSIGVYALIAYGLCSTEWKDVVMIIVGALVANLTAIVQYYFGSSSGSAAKTEIMAKAFGGPGPA